MSLARAVDCGPGEKAESGSKVSGGVTKASSYRRTKRMVQGKFWLCIIMGMLDSRVVSEFSPDGLNRHDGYGYQSSWGTARKASDLLEEGFRNI
jgi:hypothetical protein